MALTDLESVRKVVKSKCWLFKFNVQLVKCWIKHIKTIVSKLCWRAALFFIHAAYDRGELDVKYRIFQKKSSFKIYNVQFIVSEWANKQTALHELF